MQNKFKQKSFNVQNKFKQKSFNVQNKLRKFFFKKCLMLEEEIEKVEEA